MFNTHDVTSYQLIIKNFKLKISSCQSKGELIDWIKSYEVGKSYAQFRNLVRYDQIPGKFHLKTASYIVWNCVPIKIPWLIQLAPDMVQIIFEDYELRFISIKLFFIKESHCGACNFLLCSYNFFNLIEKFRFGIITKTLKINDSSSHETDLIKWKSQVVWSFIRELSRWETKTDTKQYWGTLGGLSNYISYLPTKFVQTWKIIVETRCGKERAVITDEAPTMVVSMQK